MYARIRLRLTVLNGVIVTLIFIIMTLGYLKISEDNLALSRRQTYENNVRSIGYSLDEQSVINNSWLSKLSNDGNFIITIYDNNSEFLYNKLMPSIYKEEIDIAWTYYQECKKNLDKNQLSLITYYKEFETDEATCYVITHGKNESFELFLYAPSDILYAQLIRQRFVFLIAMLVALIAIWFFSWFFIGRLLKPIEENRVKQNNFIAAASHELRTPLAVIISCIEDLHFDSLNKDSLEIIKKEAFRMSSLLKDMLNLSSSDSGNFVLEKKPVEIDTLIINVYESFEAMLGKKSISCSLNLPSDIIPTCECDKDKIYQLLAILLHNAISYTPEGGHIDINLFYSDISKDSSMERNRFESKKVGDKHSKSKFAIKASDDKHHNSKFVIEVADNGPGVLDEDKDKIFDRFFRSEKSRSVKDHFGLGLSIAKLIVEAHDGTIKVTDTDVTSKTGAKFIVTLN